jgi:hypothetical protein
MKVQDEKEPGSAILSTQKVFWKACVHSAVDTHVDQAGGYNRKSVRD